MRRRSVVALVAVSAAAAVPTAARSQASDLNEAINKAGRQRMLSQRMAKAWCALGAGVLAERAGPVLNQSIGLFERQLAELTALAGPAGIAPTYQELGAAWVDYRRLLLSDRPAVARASTLLDQANRVLAVAHRGTLDFERVAGKPVGQLVNVAGRQRMLSQRLGMLQLCAAWSGAGSPEAEVAKARQEFIAAQDRLRNAPQADVPIREQLALADAQFTFFDAALRRLKPGKPDASAMADVFTTSERILEVMDQITALFVKRGLTT